MRFFKFIQYYSFDIILHYLYWKLQPTQNYKTIKPKNLKPIKPSLVLIKISAKLYVMSEKSENYFSILFASLLLLLSRYICIMDCKIHNKGNGSI